MGCPYGKSQEASLSIVTIPLSASTSISSPSAMVRVATFVLMTHGFLSSLDLRCVSLWLNSPGHNYRQSCAIHHFTIQTTLSFILCLGNLRESLTHQCLMLAILVLLCAYMINTSSRITCMTCTGLTELL